MQFIDLATQQKRIKDELYARIQSVLKHGNYIMGPEIQELEKHLSDYIGVKHAISCSSGTDALLMALMAYGVGSGDVIFTTPFTFIATAEVITLLGATPVFVDIDPRTYNIDPEKLEQAIQAVLKKDASVYPLPENIPSRDLAVKPKGIVAVDLFGLPADYEIVNSLASKYNLFVTEDAAQSFGAEYKNKKACSLAPVACTSFFPAKPLGCYGDGGMCFTNDDDLASVLSSVRVHGKGTHKYDNIRIGINGRMDTLQAAILLAKFDIFSEEVELRQQVAKNYSDLLSSVIDKLIIPFVPEYCKSVWAQYSVLAKNELQRDMLMKKLKEAGIPSAVYYPKPLHLQTAFSYLCYQKGDFPVSEDCAERIFSLPMHPYLAVNDQKKIVNVIRENL